MLRRFLEELCRLFPPKAQIDRADFADLSSHAQARERKRWIDAAGKHQAQGCWQMLKKGEQRLMNGPIMNMVIVIENEHGFTCQTDQIVQQCGQDEGKLRNLGVRNIAEAVVPRAGWQVRSAAISALQKRVGSLSSSSSESQALA